MKRSFCFLILFLTLNCKYLTTEAQKIEKTLPNMSAEELFKKGNEAMEAKKYKIAKLYFKFIYENFPSSPYAVDALIKTATSSYLDGGWEELLDAKQKFGDFYNRYPQNENAEYALYMQGIISLKLKEKPTRDQINTMAALSYFNRYIQIYPQGKYIEEVYEGIEECNNNLALKELEVAKFYFKRKAYKGALQRLDFIVKTYPNFKEMFRVYFYYSKIYEILGDLEKKDYYYKKYEETLDILGKKL